MLLLIIMCLFEAEHMENSYVSVDALKVVKDPIQMSDNELAPYLLNIFFKIIKQCLLRHSKRPSSNQVYDKFK